MTTHRWIHRTPRIRPDGERIERGDVFEPTMMERKSWPDRIEAVETCEAVKQDGERCGRELPCRFHSEED